MTRAIFLTASLAAVLSLCGCDRIVQPARVEALEKRLSELENQIHSLQTAQAQPQALSQVPWVLWRRFVQSASTPGLLVGYTPFQAVSAYDSRPACAAAVSSAVRPGGQVVSSQDPTRVVYDNGFEEIACLPQGVAAGVQPK